jgi:hypothetical protein
MDGKGVQKPLERVGDILIMPDRYKQTLQEVKSLIDKAGI